MTATITKTPYGVTTSEDCQNGEEMLKAAGANFNIIKQQVSYPVVDTSSMPLGMDGDQPVYPCAWTPIDAHVAVRSDTMRAVTHRTVGDNYVVLQNSEMVDIVDAICSGHNLQYRYMTLLKGGAGMAMQVECPDLADSLQVGNDVNKGMLTILNRHDGTGSLRVHVSMIRMQCANALPAINREYREAAGAHKIQHGKSMHTRIDALVSSYHSAMGELQSTAEVLRALAGKRCTPASQKKFFREVLLEGRDEKELIGCSLTRFENKLTDVTRASRLGINTVSDASGSWYESLQALTYYGTHGITAKTTKSASKHENRFVSNVTGAGAQLNTRALLTAVEMSGV